MAVDIFLDGGTDQVFEVVAAGVAGEMIGDLTQLETTDKSSAVDAINELDNTKVTGEGMSLSIDDNGILTVTY